MTPWENDKCIKAFIEGDYEHYTEWCYDKNLNPENFVNQIEYCIFFNRAYIEFASEYEDRA